MPVPRWLGMVAGSLLFVGAGSNNPHVQHGMSWLPQLPPDVLAKGTARLAVDLQSGEWDCRHGHLRHLQQLDVGYRVITAHS